MAEVPEGTVNDVLDWVGDDPDRAQEALDAERSGQNRTTLVSQLEAIAERQGDDASGTQTTDPGQGGTTYAGDARDVESVPEGYDEETGMAPGPEYPEEVEIDPRDEGAVVHATVARDQEVELPDEPIFGPAVAPGRSAVTTTGTRHIRVLTEDESDYADIQPITGTQVETLDAVSAPYGLALAFNGEVFLIDPQMTAALKKIVDQTVVGLAL